MSSLAPSVNHFGPLYISPLFLIESFTFVPITSKETVDKVFGSNFTGKHHVWNFIFTPSLKDSISVDDLIKDFDSIPVNIDLDETAKIEKYCFVTNDKQYTNIIFKTIE